MTGPMERKRLGELGRGVKAGAFAGLISGLIIGMAEFFVVLVFIDVIKTSIQSSLPSNSLFTADQLVSFFLVSVPVFSIIAGVVGGILLGMIFAKTHSRYMKDWSIPVRGLVLGIVLFLLDVAVNATNIFPYGVNYLTVNLIVLLIPNLIFGYLLGVFFVRFGPRLGRGGDQETIEGCPREEWSARIVEGI